MDLRVNLVVCIGSPMIDVTARIPYDFLQKYGLKPNNAVSYNQEYSQIFADLEKCTHTTSVGGSITNTVRSAQTILSLPGVFSYIGAIGKDDAGTEICQAVQADGVNVFFEEIEDRTTGRCAVLLFEDNRSFVTDLGASKYLSIEFLEKNDIKNVITEAQYYYASALFLRVNCEIIKKICSLTQRHEKKFIFNIGAPSLCLQYLKEFKEILPYVNLLIGNEEESRQLANVLGHECEDIEGVSQFLLAQCENSENGYLNETCMIITRGDKPVTMANRGGVRKFEVPPLGIGRKLNTSGAGDHFVAGLLVNYIQNKSLQECVYGGIRSSVELIKKNSFILN